jgi:hypothetical protein
MTGQGQTSDGAVVGITGPNSRLRPHACIRRASVLLLGWSLLFAGGLFSAGRVQAADPPVASVGSVPAGSVLPVAIRDIAPAGTDDAGTLADTHHALGLNPTPGLPKGLSKAFSSRLRVNTSYPASYDLSAWAAPVGNQGNVGSCASWATGYYYRSWLRNHDKGDTTTFAPMYLYSQLAQGQRDRGSSFNENFTILRNQGIAPRSMYWQGDYDYTTQPDDAERAAAASYTTGTASLLFSGAGGIGHQTAIEATISGGSPILFRIPVYANFEAASSANPYVDVPSSGSTRLGWHGVFAAAYDEWGVWIENSWGTSYGRAGWVEVSWAFIDGYASEAWTMTDAASPAWSVSLDASATTAAPGASVTLTATANSDVTVTPYYLVILRGDGGVVKSCGSGSLCAVAVSSDTPASWSYSAVIGTSNGGSPVATSPPVTVTWQADCTVVPAGPWCKPTAPTDFAATGASPSEIRLTWSDASGEMNYRVSRLEGSSWVVAGTAGADATTFADTGRPAGAGYWYELCAVNDTGDTCAAATVWGAVLVPPKPTVVIDDRSAGFTRGGSGWHAVSAGYLHHLWWATVHGSAASRWGQWISSLTVPGTYRVSVYIPRTGATTRSARYVVYAATGRRTVVVNQNVHKGWVSLGTFTFGAVARVRLTDATRERASTRRQVAFDAVRFAAP